MVQGQKCANNTVDAISRENKRAGFESMQKKQQEQTNKASFTAANKKTTGTGASNNKYGAWGPVFQNRENFNSMHFC